MVKSPLKMTFGNKRNIKREKVLEGTNRAQEEEDDCQRMLAQVQAVESGVERINGLGNSFK